MSQHDLLALNAGAYPTGPRDFIAPVSALCTSIARDPQEKYGLSGFRVLWWFLGTCPQTPEIYRFGPIAWYGQEGDAPCRRSRHALCKRARRGLTGVPADRSRKAQDIRAGVSCRLPAMLLAGSGKSPVHDRFGRAWITEVRKNRMNQKCRSRAYIVRPPRTQKRLICADSVVQ
jgi:hypothetical protein